MSNIPKQKFIKSKKGVNCASICYPPNIITKNPITMVPQTSYKNYCHLTYDPDEPLSKKSTIDECDELDTKTNTFIEGQNSILYPTFLFNEKYFLKVYYKLNTSDDIYNYLSLNPNLPLRNKTRIIECYLKEYGRTTDFIDKQIILFFNELIYKKWSFSLFKFLHKTSNNHTDYLEQIEKLNELYNTYTIVETILYEFFKIYKKDWNNINNYILAIKKFYLNYIKDNYINKIN